MQQLQGREPEGWQRQSLTESINSALVALVPLDSSPDRPSFLFLMAQQQQAIKVRQLVQQLPRFLAPPEQWGPGLSETVIISGRAILTEAGD